MWCNVAQYALEKRAYWPIVKKKIRWSQYVRIYECIRDLVCDTCKKRVIIYFVQFYYLIAQIDGSKSAELSLTYGRDQREVLKEGLNV